MRRIIEDMISQVNKISYELGQDVGRYVDENSIQTELDNCKQSFLKIIEKLNQNEAEKLEDFIINRRQL